MVGVAALLAPAASARAQGAPRVAARVPTREAQPTDDASGAPLVAPVKEGSVLGPWRVVEVGSVQAGALTLTLLDGSGRTFFLDVCRRDDGLGAPVPPARTDMFDIFVANEGDGLSPTLEDHGLAAMALAEVVRANEHAVQVSDILTLRERLRRHRSRISRGRKG